MFNDDTHVAGFLKDCYPLERARDYEGVGCWEGAVSSSTDAQFANYTSVIKPFVAAIYRDPAAERRARVTIEPFDGCTSIEELKRRALRNYLSYVRDLLSTYARYGRFFSKVSPRPLYSACLDGCLARRRDEFDQGLRFQPRSLTLGFLANVVDSICALDKVVFRDRFCTLDEFLAAVRSNWAGAHMLQPNCTDVATLLDAQKHPERHMDIIVKVCGFSARFVSLSPQWQREVIERHRLTCAP